MKQEVKQAIEEAAREMHRIHGKVNSYILSKKLACNVDIVKENLRILGYVESGVNMFVLKS